MLAQIARDMPPLRGIFHLAGVLDDGILREQSRERFDRVMAAKVHGAWNLHELTRERARRWSCSSSSPPPPRSWARRAKAITPRPMPSWTPWPIIAAR